MVSMGVADSESSFDTMSGALLEAVKAAVGNDQSPWPDLVTGLDASLTDKVRMICITLDCRLIIVRFMSMQNKSSSWPHPALVARLP